VCTRETRVASARRAGVGHLTIVDGDAVDMSNKNRQLPALDSTVGRAKATVMAERLRDINPDVDLTVLNTFLDPDSAAALLEGRNADQRGAVEDHGKGLRAAHCRYDYVVDCIDSIAPKKTLICAARRAGGRVISSMGAGGRMDASRVRVVDLFDTYNDPFAANIRRGLRKMGVASDVVAVWSDEPVKHASLEVTDQRFKRSYYGTISYIPA